MRNHVWDLYIRVDDHTKVEMITGQNLAEVLVKAYTHIKYLENPEVISLSITRGKSI